MHAFQVKELRAEMALLTAEERKMKAYVAALHEVKERLVWFYLFF